MPPEKLMLFYIYRNVKITSWPAPFSIISFSLYSQSYTVVDACGNFNLYFFGYPYLAVSVAFLARGFYHPSRTTTLVTRLGYAEKTADRAYLSVPLARLAHDVFCSRLCATAFTCRAYIVTRDFDILLGSQRCFDKIYFQFMPDIPAAPGSCSSASSGSCSKEIRIYAKAPKKILKTAECIPKVPEVGKVLPLKSACSESTF